MVSSMAHEDDDAKAQLCHRLVQGRTSMDVTVCQSTITIHQLVTTVELIPLQQSSSVKCTNTHTRSLASKGVDQGYDSSIEQVIT